MTNIDPYETLGVERDATADQIKRAYRRLALKLHPDKNPGDATAAERFKRVSEAYEILSDPEKKRQFDSGGMDGVQAAGFEGFETNEEIFSHFGDVFGDLFGRRYQRAHQGPERGGSPRFTLPVSFLDAARGAEREVAVPLRRPCATCRGTGTQSGQPRGVCTTCQGSGHATRQARREGGYFSVSSVCPDCEGTGRQSGDPCAECHGAGSVLEETRIAVRIPPGVTTGQVLRLAGQGEAGRHGGPRGDLLFEIEVQSHPSFQRDGLNIRSDVTVPVAVALLGGKVDVPTIRGTVVLTVPPGTSSDRVLRIRGQGIATKKATGDHLARIVISVPQDLSPEARAAVKEYLS